MAAVDVHGGWPAVLSELIAGQDLDREVAAAALQTILAGDATDAEIAAFIVGLRHKGESIEELVGLVDAMLGAAAPLDLPPDVIDIVGVGGALTRRSHALNVSTMACFVAAGAGALVCKHGNVRASSTSGSFDLLDELGITIDLDGRGVRRCLDEAGVAFAFARAFHPAMRHAAAVRTQLGVPTVFNVLGPLSHPGRVQRQVIGVSDRSLAPKVAGVLAAREVTAALVVHGSDGLDELTVTGPNLVIEVRDGEVVFDGQLDPADLGFARATFDELAGGGPERNAAIVRGLLDGTEHGPRRDIVILNAAAGLLVAGIATDMADGVARATVALEDGSAAGRLAAVVAASAAAQ